MSSESNSNHGIPIMNQPVNMMEVGANGSNLAATAIQRHPVEVLQKRQASTRISFLGTEEEEEVRRLYGTGFAMKLATERRMANEFGMNSIGGGIPSSTNLMSDIVSGRDQTIGFEDTLGLPEYRPMFNKVQEDPHMAMERNLGM
ncbi:proteasome maturation factor UMP1 [Nitzschia inconspicua]|uniref:Proteasome maturation factor UMP1 n=1 Tax=Nitzschia inconspicua TaxID=303405 RepID=A0A9K3LHE7_9STRA|nr:proteasome maturation factor UMP1 [Nitzschia inconspicua]